MSGLNWGLSEVIAAGCGPVVKLWAPTEPQQAIKVNEGTPVYWLDFSHNNRVLAVGGDKGQATLYGSKGASVQTGAPAVGSVPRAPDDSADAITCIKFAPSDSSLVMGCRNGLVHVWSLKDEGASTADQLTGSVTSVAVNKTATIIAASSSSGQVVLRHFPSCRKQKTLHKGGVRTGCLGFSGEHLLCGARDSGQLLVWDVTNSSQHPEELNVHKRAVTGCMFSPVDSHLLVSCGADGLLVCTDRRAQQVVWETQLHQPLSSLTMRWDGSMLAVGTVRGRVLVHDTRRISTTLATQEFSDELPVTALCWQNKPHEKSHKRNSLGTASAAAAAAADTAADSSGNAAPSTQGGRGSAAAAATAARGGSGVSAGGAQHKAAPVVPQLNMTPLSQMIASSSSEQEYGMRVISPPLRIFSPQDSDGNSAAAADVPGGVLHTPDAVGGAVQTPADSASSGPGYKGPVMFTPGLAYMGGQGFGGVTPFGGLAADVTPTSMLADTTAAAAAAAPTQPTRERKAEAAAAAAPNSSAGLPADSRGPERIQRGSAGGVNPALPASRGASQGISSTAAGRGSSRASGGGTADAPTAPSSHKRKPSDSTSVAVAAAGGSKSLPSSAATDSRSVQDTAGAAADGSVVVTAKGVGSGAGVGSKPTVGSGGLAVAGHQQISSSSGGQPATAQAGKAAASNAAALGVSGAALREDVFKAYVEKRMDAIEDAINGLRNDMNKRLEQAQDEMAMVASSLAARQDQLAEAITQLTAAVQSLSVGKQQQHEQTIMYPVPSVAMIPWI